MKKTMKTIFAINPCIAGRFAVGFSLLMLPMLAMAQAGEQATGEFAAEIGSGNSALPNYVQMDRGGTDQCQWMAVEDGADYFIPLAFEAKLATNNSKSTNPSAIPNRTSDKLFVGNSANSIYLPFDFYLTDGVKGYNLSYYNMHESADATDNTFVFVEQEGGNEYSANTPYLVIGDGGADAKIVDAENVVVGVSPISVHRTVNPVSGTTVDNPFSFKGNDLAARVSVSDDSTPVNTWWFCGTTETANNTTVSSWNDMGESSVDGSKLVSMWGDLQTKVMGAGNVWGIAAAGVPAGRVFMGQSAGTPGAKMNFAIAGLDGTVTGIDQVTNDSQQATDNKVYTIDGKYVGNDLNKLASGIYILNGKKIIK